MFGEAERTSVLKEEILLLEAEPAPGSSRMVAPRWTDAG